MKSPQIARHAAVVLAGMASIGFTVAAGTYIVNEMASNQRDAAARPVRVEPGPPGMDGPLAEQAAAPQQPVVTARFTAQARVYPAVAAVPRPAAPTTQPAVSPTVVAVQTNPTMGDRLPSLSDAYLGAKVSRTEPDSLSMTVNTNLFTELIAGADASGTQVGDTQLRTDLDVRHGRITLAVSDPALGEHAVQLSPRHTEPASADHQDQIAQA
ncbi:hypothetical protein ABIA39_002532 [Nocardia sp. GAS34]|uniref:hypothetical protein n=1 Tax=unclassified Nocardia TaxID=2637762 RepID=UPI003D197E41